MRPAKAAPVLCVPGPPTLGGFSSGLWGIGAFRPEAWILRRVADVRSNGAYTIISPELPSSLKIVRSNRHSSRWPAVWPPCLR